MYLCNGLGIFIALLSFLRLGLEPVECANLTDCIPLYFIHSKRNVLLANPQVHHPDLIAQAGGHLDRENYVNNLGLDPEYKEEFQGMVNLLWPWLHNQVEQLRQVSLALWLYVVLLS